MQINKIKPYIHGVLIGMAFIIALNSFDKVVTLNIWPSVLTAQGDL